MFGINTRFWKLENPCEYKVGDKVRTSDDKKGVVTLITTCKESYKDGMFSYKTYMRWRIDVFLVDEGTISKDVNKPRFHGNGGIVYISGITKGWKKPKETK